MGRKWTVSETYGHDITNKPDAEITRRAYVLVTGAGDD